MMTLTCPRCNASYTHGGFICRWCLDELQRLDRRRRLDGRDPVPFTKPGKLKGVPVKIVSYLVLFLFALLTSPVFAGPPVTAETPKPPGDCCVVCYGSALPRCHGSGAPETGTFGSARADAGLAFEYTDGTSWTELTGTVEGGVFVDAYAAGGNDNASSGQDCGGVDDNACFLSLTLAWSNAYSNATGPTGFVLTSTDGSVRLTCERSDITVAGHLVKMAVHDCSVAWSSGAVWSSPTDCGGPQGTNLGECIGYAYTQSH